MNDKIDELANAFLRWQLPESVCADPCATKQGSGRVGTNLLSFTEAKQMMQDIVGPTLAELEADEARLLLNELNYGTETGEPCAEIIKLRAKLAVAHADRAALMAEQVNRGVVAERVIKQRDVWKNRYTELERDFHEMGRSKDAEFTVLRARVEEAEKQKRLAWDRHAEKDRAYGDALAERDAAIKARDSYGLIAAKATAAEAQLRAEVERLKAIVREDELLKGLLDP